MDCKNNCRLDGNLSITRSRDRRNAVVHCINLSDNFWSVSLTILSHLLSLCLSPLYVGQHGPFRILTFIMVLLHIRTSTPAVSLNYLLAVTFIQGRQLWNKIGVPTQSHPQTESLTFLAWNNSGGIEEHQWN